MAHYVSNSLDEQKKMLDALELNSIEELYQDIPKHLFVKKELTIDKGKDEHTVKSEMLKYAKQNKVYSTIFRGNGAYRHLIPSSVDALANRAEFVTSYTPYQAELSQGTLQVLFEYQSTICELTGMDISNASVYDGATAAAEAIMMAQERNKETVLIASTIKKQNLDVIKTYCGGYDMEIVLVDEVDGRMSIIDLKNKLSDKVCGLYVEQINKYGLIEDVKSYHETLDENIHLIMGFNPLASMILPSGKEVGADIVVGEGQPLGVPLSYGGPYLGIMACTDQMMRRLPGRIVGMTTDRNGNDGYVLTLQAREQHIRRNKASSSICSNQSLMALRAQIYTAAMGQQGLLEAAHMNVANSHYLANRFSELKGFSLKYDDQFFNEFVIKSECSTKEILDTLHKNDILGGYPIDEHHLLWCATEANSKEEMDKLIEILGGIVC